MYQGMYGVRNSKIVWIHTRLRLLSYSRRVHQWNWTGENQLSYPGVLVFPFEQLHDGAILQTGMMKMCRNEKYQGMAIKRVTTRDRRKNSSRPSKRVEEDIHNLLRRTLELWSD
jgi:hypothetical protein